MKKPCNNCSKNKPKNRNAEIFCKEVLQCEKFKKYETYLENKRQYVKGNTRLNTIDEVLNQDMAYFPFGIKNKKFTENLRCVTLQQLLSIGIYNVEKKRERN